MGFARRKLLPMRNAAAALCDCDPYRNTDGYCLESCFKVCPDVCRNIIVFGGDVMSPPVFSSPPPPPPPPPSPLPPPLTDYIDRTHYTNQKHLIETSMIVGACMIGASVILCILFAILRFYSNRRNRRSRSPALFASQEDFLDEDHGPVLDHPIWYIHTVGLPQALIDKITIFKYRKDEGLTDGIDCSVCLSEFEEDQSLRLLPKCSHAFHIPCIDTWLRSHKNCPLCRAPVFSSTASDQVSVPDSVSSGSGSGDSIPLENLENVEGIGRGSSEVVVTDDENIGAILVDEMNVETSEKVLADSIVTEGSCDARALSDLADNRRVAEDDLQPVRRSVSMDSMSASRVYRDVANVIPEQGSSNSQVVLVKSAKSGILSKQASASSSLFKHLRSSSNGSSLQMGPISMKRPFPPSKKQLSSKHGRSVSSILPL